MIIICLSLMISPGRTVLFHNLIQGLTANLQVVQQFVCEKTCRLKTSLSFAATQTLQLLISIAAQSPTVKIVPRLNHSHTDSIDQETLYFLERANRHINRSALCSTVKHFHPAAKEAFISVSQCKDKSEINI